MTHTLCSACGRKIPWGERRYLILRKDDVEGEVCFGCIVKAARGSTATASGDSAPSPPAQAHPRGDSGGGGARKSRQRPVAPERQVPVRRNQ